MASSAQTVSVEELTNLNHQCTALHEDWQRFYQLAASPPEQDPNARHLAFIQLQSRLSCDYPILSHWQKGNFGLSSHISKLVAQTGTLESFAKEVQQGGGPLVEEWKSVNDSIGRVRKLLGEALGKAKKGKDAKLPKEIAAPKERRQIDFRPALRKLRTACIVLVCCAVVFVLVQPLFVETSLLNWFDDLYTAWKIRNGIPGLE